LDTQGKFWYDESNDVLKIYSQDNPAIYYSNKALEKATAINYNFGIANANIALAWAYYTRSNHEKAKLLCDEAIKHYKKTENYDVHIGSCYRLLAAIGGKEKKAEEREIHKTCGGRCALNNISGIRRCVNTVGGKITLEDNETCAIQNEDSNESDSSCKNFNGVPILKKDKSTLETEICPEDDPFCNCSKNFAAAFPVTNFVEIS